MWSYTGNMVSSITSVECLVRRATGELVIPEGGMKLANDHHANDHCQRVLCGNLGPIVRIAPYEYSIDDPEATKEIYGLGGNFVKVCLFAHPQTRTIRRQCKAHQHHLELLVYSQR